jgi:hypothetical protein
LEYAAGAAEKLDISGLGTAGYLIQPAHRRGFETRLGGAVGRVDHLDFHLYGILTPLDPAFTFFASLVHGLHYSGK